MTGAGVDVDKLTDTNATTELCDHRWWLLTDGHGAYTGALEGCDGYPLSTHRCVDTTANHRRGHRRGCGATTPAQQLCGHGWTTGTPIGDFADGHRCAEAADHPVPCTCQCGATTRPEGER